MTHLHGQKQNHGKTKSKKDIKIQKNNGSCKCTKNLGILER